MASSTTRRQTEKRKKKQNQAPHAQQTSSIFFRLREKKCGPEYGRSHNYTKSEISCVSLFIILVF